MALRSVFPRLIAASLLFSLAACKRESPAPPPPEETATPEPAPELHADASTPRPAMPRAATAVPRPPKTGALHTPPPPAELWKEFSGEKAFEQVRKQVEIGPRPSGSAELDKARTLIIDAVTKFGWQVERQEFSGDTPRGQIKFINLIARYKGSTAAAPPNTQQAIVCSHYDTKRFSTIKFVGASDGASSTGALVELARVLSLDPAFAAKIELVFFDGEEAVQQFTELDGLYGSKHYAQDLRATGRNRQFHTGILWDMIGDRDLTITLPPDSPADVAQGIFAAAEMLGCRKNFGYHSLSITDDHVPLNQAGIRTIDLIDFDYTPWHTADDTLDKLAPESLQKAGAVTVYFLKKAVR